MPDEQRPDPTRDIIDHTVGQSLDQLLADLPPELHEEALNRLWANMSRVLAEAPSPDGRAVQDMTIRARLAAAFDARIKSRS